MLKIVGDINLTDGYFDVGFGVGSKLKQGFDPFQHIQRNAEDCWIGNFEGVASESSEKSGNAALQFRVNPEYLSHLKHFDLYGIANNHAMQHGAAAYQCTFDYLSSCGCLCFGSNAQKSQVFEHQDKKVSITGFSQRIDAFSQEPCYWHNPEYKEIEQEINQLPEDAFKIVFVHWGNEFINRPSSPQKRFAHWLVDAGFDIVIGMHPHVLQGYEQNNGKYIFYSLGNFVFDMPWEPTKYGAVVSLDLSKMRLSLLLNMSKSTRNLLRNPLMNRWCRKHADSVISISNFSKKTIPRNTIPRSRVAINNIAKPITRIF